MGETTEIIISTLAALLLLGALIYWLWRTTPTRRREPLEPLDARGWLLVVDGSNVSYRENKARLKHLEEVLDLLRHRFQGADLLVYCDASLRHQFRGKERQRFEALLAKDPTFRQAPKGRKADDFILAHAAENPRAIVVSHDRFSKGPELEMRLKVPLLRISFHEDPPLLAEKILRFEDEDDPERPSLYELETFLASHERGAAA